MAELTSFENITEQQLEDVVKTIIGLADGASEAIQKAIAWVILNRWRGGIVLNNRPDKDKFWSEDLSKVCRNFSCWDREDALEARVSRDGMSESIRAWLPTLHQQPDPTNGAILYYKINDSANSQTRPPKEVDPLSKTETDIEDFKFFSFKLLN